MHAQKTKVVINRISETGDNYMEVRRMLHEHINAIKEMKKGTEDEKKNSWNTK